MSKAKQILQASEAAKRLIFPEGETAKAVPVNVGKGIEFIFDDGSALTVGKVTIDYAGWSPAGTLDEGGITEMKMTAMNCPTAKQLLAQLESFRHCNEKEIISDGDYVRVTNTDQYAHLHGGYTADQLEAIAFWMRNPAIFAASTHSHNESPAPTNTQQVPAEG